MMLINKTLNEYISETDSTSPTPGGGSVAALIGTLASSLARMYGHLSINKKAFQQLDKETQDRFVNSFDVLNDVKEKLTILIDEDSKSYNMVVQAYRLPKETIEEKTVRTHAIQEATKLAIKTPYDVILQSVSGLNALEHMIPYGNKNVVSDIAMAIHLFPTVIDCSIINMRINMSSLDDKELVDEYEKFIKKIGIDTNEKKELLIDLVNQYM